MGEGSSRTKYVVCSSRRRRKEEREAIIRKRLELKEERKEWMKDSKKVIIQKRTNYAIKYIHYLLRSLPDYPRIIYMISYV